MKGGIIRANAVRRARLASGGACRALLYEYGADKLEA